MDLRGLIQIKKERKERKVMSRISFYLVRVSECQILYNLAEQNIGC